MKKLICKRIMAVLLLFTSVPALAMDIEEDEVAAPQQLRAVRRLQHITNAVAVGMKMDEEQLRKQREVNWSAFLKFMGVKDMKWIVDGYIGNSFELLKTIPSQGYNKCLSASVDRNDRLVASNGSHVAEFDLKSGAITKTFTPFAGCMCDPNALRPNDNNAHGRSCTKENRICSGEVACLIALTSNRIMAIPQQNASRGQVGKIFDGNGVSQHTVQLTQPWESRRERTAFYEYVLLPDGGVVYAYQIWFELPMTSQKSFRCVGALYPDHTVHSICIDPEESAALMPDGRIVCRNRGSTWALMNPLRMNKFCEQISGGKRITLIPEEVLYGMRAVLALDDKRFLVQNYKSSEHGYVSLTAFDLEEAQKSEAEEKKWNEETEMTRLGALLASPASLADPDRDSRIDAVRGVPNGFFTVYNTKTKTGAGRWQLCDGTTGDSVEGVPAFVGPVIGFANGTFAGVDEKDNIAVYQKTPDILDQWVKEHQATLPSVPLAEASVATSSSSSPSSSSSSALVVRRPSLQE